MCENGNNFNGAIIFMDRWEAFCGQDDPCYIKIVKKTISLIKITNNDHNNKSLTLPITNKTVILYLPHID